MIARLVRDSPAIVVKSLRIDSSVRSSRMRAPVGPPARPVAITGRPNSFSARATLTPLPPATVLDSTARCLRPSLKLGTATVLSIAAFNVTVRITPALASSRTFGDDLNAPPGPSRRPAPRQRGANQDHDRHQPDNDDPDDYARAGDRVVHIRHHGVAGGRLHPMGGDHRHPADRLP